MHTNWLDNWLQNVGPCECFSSLRGLIRFLLLLFGAAERP